MSIRITRWWKKDELPSNRLFRRSLMWYKSWYRCPLHTGAPITKCNESTAAAVELTWETYHSTYFHLFGSIYPILQRPQLAPYCSLKQQQDATNYYNIRVMVCQSITAYNSYQTRTLVSGPDLHSKQHMFIIRSQILTLTDNCFETTICG